MGGDACHGEMCLTGVGEEILFCRLAAAAAVRLINGMSFGVGISFRLRMFANCKIALLVSCPASRLGSGDVVGGLDKIETMSIAAWRKKASVVTFGNGIS